MAEPMNEAADAVYETDYLIVGGGLVGMMSAIRMKKQNKEIRVTIIDKARMEYSGDGVGLDNFNQIPFRKEDRCEKNISADDVKNSIFGANRMKGLVDYRLDAVQMRHAYISEPLLEEIGVQIREDDGSLKVLQGYRKGTVWGHVEYDKDGKPYEPLFGTFSRAADLKSKLGRAVRKTDAEVFDRTMLTSILTKDGKAVGVTAINTRNNKFFVFKAKAILLATGAAARLYPYPYVSYPNNLFYTLTSPVNDGGGHVCALNSGAKLWGMELCTVYNVSKGVNHSSGGGACNWYFKMYNSKGECLEEKYADNVVTKAGGKIPGVNFLFSPNMQHAEVENDVILSPKDKATDDEIAAVYFTAVTEPPKALKFHKLAGGLTNEAPVECIPVLVGIGMAGGGVVRETENAETAVKNLFAAGNVVGRGGSHGFTWGCIIADYLAERLPDQHMEKFTTEQDLQVEAAKNRTFAPLHNDSHYEVNPLQLEDYIRNINYQYVGLHRNKPRMERAVELLRLAKKGAVPLLSAANPHELMRAIEVQNILVISQLHAQSALMRNESRIIPVHYRDDYPDLDERWDGIAVTAEKRNGQIVYTKEPLNREHTDAA